MSRVRMLTCGKVEFFSDYYHSFRGVRYCLTMLLAYLQVARYRDVFANTSK